MSSSAEWLDAERKLDLSQLEYLFDCVRTFEVTVQNEGTYTNVISDLVILDIIAQDTLLLREEDIYLKTDRQGKVIVSAPEDLDGYEVTGKNFYMLLYE